MFVPSKSEVYPEECNIFEIIFPMVLDGVVLYNLLSIVSFDLKKELVSSIICAAINNNIFAHILSLL